MRRGVPAAAAAILLFFGCAAAHGEDAVAALGKQRAQAAHIAWEIREANHPVLGPIRFAHTRGAIVTPVGDGHVFSSAYISCETGARTIAIELTNQRAPDEPGGLRPAAMPRLVCNAPAAAGKTGTVQETLEATWHVNEIGDVLAHGFRPKALRACASIGIVQDVELPAGWGKPTASVVFAISPYAKDLDAIFVACGEASAYGPAVVARAAARSVPWKTARTIAHGRTNVRARPDVGSAVVAELDPGTTILIQSTGGAWWHVKSRGGAPFEGYIRADRLVIR